MSYDAMFFDILEYVNFVGTSNICIISIFRAEAMTDVAFDFVLRSTGNLQQ